MFDAVVYSATAAFGAILAFADQVIKAQDARSRWELELPHRQELEAEKQAVEAEQRQLELVATTERERKHRESLESPVGLLRNRLSELKERRTQVNRVLDISRTNNQSHAMQSCKDELIALDEQETLVWTRMKELGDDSEG